MILLFRAFLIGLIIYLLFTAFSRYADSGNEHSAEKQNVKNGKRISKDTGEVVDYEELKK
jgi:hypothetical protein